MGCLRCTFTAVPVEGCARASTAPGLIYPAPGSSGLDQRGCGRSVPHASDPLVSLSDSTTTQLIADLDRLREHLGIQAWIVNGASWGSTLALAYAQTHPHRVLGIVLYAVTTTSRSEVDWVTEGMQAVFPEAWDRLASHAEAAGLGYRRGDGRLVEAYAQLMNSA